MTSLPPSLLILGGSTRSAAASAVRAGFQPICADRFGDEDLRRLATVLPVRDYPHGLLAAVESLPPTPWLYVGAIENEPELIEAISRRHPLLGNSSEVLQRVRDPFWLSRTLGTHELPALRSVPENELPLSQDGWLMKPIRSGGGLGIRLWNGVRRESEHGVYFQEQRAGRPISALFIASSSGVRNVGVCEQLIGQSVGAPMEFGYAGSIGPIDVSRITLELIEQIGTVLANEAGLRGLFGCDFILADDVPWLTEVNPRYTASVEVLERATNWPLLKWHVMACHSEQLEADLPLEGDDPQTATPTSQRTIVGKRIVFATTDVLAPDLEKLMAEEPGRSAWRAIDQEPWLADIPAPDSLISAGWPICTVFAHAASVLDCRDLLERRANAIKQWVEVRARKLLPDADVSNPKRERG